MRSLNQAWYSASVTPDRVSSNGLGRLSQIALKRSLTTNAERRHQDQHVTVSAARLKLLSVLGLGQAVPCVLRRATDLAPQPRVADAAVLQVAVPDEGIELVDLTLDDALEL